METTWEEWYENVGQYQKKAQEYLKEADACLARRTAESIVTFIEIFRDEDILHHYVYSITELAYAHIMAAITVDEINHSRVPGFILNGTSVEELTAVLKKLEFALWEAETGGREAAEQRLYERLCAYRVTPEALKTIIKVAGLHKRSCYELLACIYLDHRETEQAIRILRYATETFPEDEAFRTVLARLCEKTGNSSLSDSSHDKTENIFCS